LLIRSTRCRDSPASRRASLTDDERREKQNRPIRTEYIPDHRIPPLAAHPGCRDPRPFGAHGDGFPARSGGCVGIRRELKGGSGGPRARGRLLPALDRLIDGLDQRLVRAAGTSARYQASRGRIGHRGPGGSRAWDRARSAGYSPHLTAENVASGQKSFSEAMRGWERSASHKRNLLLPDAEAAGVAVSYRNGRAYYTLVLGAE